MNTPKTCPKCHSELAPESSSFDYWCGSYWNCSHDLIHSDECKRRVAMMLKPRLQVYTCTTFAGFYPVGTAAIVEAEDAHQAARILNDRLHVIGLAGDLTANDMRLFPAHDKEDVRILCDGEY